jgi:hypothetical protein
LLALSGLPLPGRSPTPLQAAVQLLWMKPLERY